MGLYQKIPFVIAAAFGFMVDFLVIKPAAEAHAADFADLGPLIEAVPFFIMIALTVGLIFALVKD